MNQQVTQLTEQLKSNQIIFSQVIDFINANYEHTSTAFKNGEVFNEDSQNQGSARVFAFAQLNNLNQADTLLLFAEHYQAVLVHPEGIDHQNIRQFMQHGWQGIEFKGIALKAK